MKYKYYLVSHKNSNKTYTLWRINWKDRQCRCLNGKYPDLDDTKITYHNEKHWFKYLKENNWIVKRVTREEAFLELL